MSLLDSAMSALSGGSDGNQSSLLGEAVNFVQNQPGGISGLVQQLQSQGLGDVVQSWISNGSNLPISADQIQQVLGSDTVQQIASKIGIDPDTAASGLSQALPELINHLTPNGEVPADEDLLSQGLNLLKGKLFS
ncbi:YidB family protein [Acidithiobacillus concretivorus]|uniref:DUF937 domain-containing protein n=1 Tax=Acidithiobacillus concretivorus TaxID=3063952 RepID=A0ABS5ZMI7_9PROT|nr:YidB family protein [Acidithiobacillus concretivorus]MBU2737859.1 DUF937 domain-containing protein [Acidithiobacillus concretivorus]